MKLYDFQMLDEKEQQKAVWEGVPIADRRMRNTEFYFYQIGSFYVEEFYHKDKNIIVQYNPFAATEKLQPYLVQIDISSVFDEAP